MPSNLARKSARRKQQTRLAFDPIDPDLRSPSPATKMSPANVRYHLPNQRPTPSSSRTTYIFGNGEESDDVLSSSKKSHMIKGKGKAKANDGKLPFKTLPTPVKSSQAVAKEKETYNTVESEDDEFESNKILTGHPKSTHPRSSTNTIGTSLSKRRGRPIVDLEDSDGSAPEEEVETPSKNKKGKQKAFALSASRDLDQDGEDSDDLPALPQRNTRSTRASTASKSAPKTKARRQKSVTLSSDSDDELVFPVPKDSKRRKISKPVKMEPQAVENDDSDDDRPIASSSRRQRKSIVADDDESDDDLPIITKLMNYSKSPENDRSKKQAIEIEDDSDDDIIATSPTKLRPRVSILEDEESDEEPISSPLKKHRRPAAVDSDDPDIPSSPRKRSRQVIEEDEHDDSDLPSVKNIRSKGKGRSGSTSSSNTPARITRQTKARKHRTTKEKQMELLKRKRAGEDIEELTDSTEESDRPKKGAYDTDSDLEILSNFEDESEPEVVPKPKKKRKSNVDSYNLSEDSDFIVEDDEAPIGVPDHYNLIPHQFRHTFHKQGKEHFKDAIEWMVHRKINPAFPRDDEVYLQAFKKLDDEYQGYAKSKFVSTQWTAEFTKAIYARPTFVERPCAEGEGYTLDGVPKCDVCNHRKHYPKFAIHFEGKPYYKATLEEVEKDSENEDSDDEDDDDAVSVNSKGHSLPAEDKEWFSGNVCRDNAQQAHTLIHWKYALNEWVVDQLTNEGYFSPDNLVEREKMKAKERSNYANNLVDGWEKDGVIKELYGDFKRQLEAARESKQGRWGKGHFMGFG